MDAYGRTLCRHCRLLLAMVFGWLPRRVGRERGNELRLPSPASADEIVLELTRTGDAGASNPAPVGEIELWGVDRPATRLDARAIRRLAASSKALRSAAPGLDIIPILDTGTIDLAPGSEPGGHACGSLHFSLTRSPASYQRAWVGYTAEGAFRSFALTRALNAAPARHGQWFPAPRRSGRSATARWPEDRAGQVRVADCPSSTMHAAARRMWRQESAAEPGLRARRRVEALEDARLERVDSGGGGIAPLGVLDREVRGFAGDQAEAERGWRRGAAVLDDEHAVVAVACCAGVSRGAGPGALRGNSAAVPSVSYHRSHWFTAARATSNSAAMAKTFLPLM